MSTVNAFTKEDFKDLSKADVLAIASTFGIKGTSKKAVLETLIAMNYDDAKSYKELEVTFLITKTLEVVVVSSKSKLKGYSALSITEKMAKGLYEASYIIGYINNKKQDILF